VLLLFGLFLAPLIPADLRSGHHFWVRIVAADEVLALTLIVASCITLAVHEAVESANGHAVHLRHSPFFGQTMMTFVIWHRPLRLLVSGLAVWRNWQTRRVLEQSNIAVPPQPVAFGREGSSPSTATWSCV
jgi:hypothetical protein